MLSATQQSARALGWRGRRLAVGVVFVLVSVLVPVAGTGAAPFDALDGSVSLASTNNQARGIWSDGTTMWVTNYGGKVYAYTLATGARDSAKDITALDAAGNDRASGLWSDGTTMWVADIQDDKIYAYDLAAGTRDSGSDLDGLVDAGNLNAKGIWSDGTTMWVVDIDDDKIYAYDLATGDRDSGNDIDGLAGDGNDRAMGIWSDGDTMWVADGRDDKIYAYDLASGDRDSTRDFDTLGGAGNGNPTALWSDGDTMWVADVKDRKIYPYEMPAPPDETPAGAPVITGTVEVGEALSADTSGISDGNGLTAVQFTYQWVRSSAGTDTDISGATGQSYTLTADDRGSAVKVRVSFIDDDGYAQTLTSAATDTVPLATQLQGTSDDGICDRNAKVQEVILTKVPVSDCADVTSDHLADVTALVIDFGETAATVDGDDFAGLSSLRLLILRGSGLTSVATGSFDELVGATRFYIENTSITTLPANILDKMTKLTRVDLEYNAITTLPDDLFAELTEVHTIDLIGNNDYRNSFPIDAFDHLEHLTGLWIPLLPAPRLHTAEVTGDSLMLTYDLPVKTNWRTSKGAFTVEINGVSVTVDELTMHRRAIELTLSQSAVAGDSVTVTYARPSRGASLSPTYGLGAWYDKNLGAHDQRVATYSDVEVDVNL